MRKQDRIARDQEQNRSDDHAKPSPQPRAEEREQLRGRATDEPPGPQRQPGKLPLPD
jgi:hypothetical protein